MHPFVRSLLIYFFLGVCYYFFEPYFLPSVSGSSRSSIGLFFVIGMLTSISFVSPFYFFQKIDLGKSISVFFCVYFFVASIFYFSDEYRSDLDIFIPKFLTNYLSIEELLLFVISPLGLFLISKYFIKVNWKLLPLLFSVFPIVLVLDDSIFYKFLELFFMEPLLFIFILIHNVASNIYVAFLFKNPPLHDINEDILDAPDI